MDPIDIKKARKKKENTEKSGKVPPADLYHAIMDAINGGQWNLLPNFPCKLHLIEPDRGTKIPLMELADQVVVQVSPKHVINLIMQYTQRELMDNDAYRFTVQQAKFAYDYWEASTKAIPPPAMVLWADEPGLTYRRLPWTQGLGETPLWDELVGRMGAQGDAFIAWVGSLFFKDSDRQQYLWLYGQGQNGKGAITRFLGEVLGAAFRSELPPGPGDRFWTRNLLGARLVSFPDCNSIGFPASGLFKSMTGGDGVRMEIKNGAVFHAELGCKFMFSSNEKPTLSSEAADMRRPIFINLDAISCAPDPGYERKLWAEGGRFLSGCIAIYESSYPGHGRLAVDNEDLVGHVVTTEERFADILNTEFVIHPFNKNAMLRDYPYAIGAQLQRMYRTMGMNEAEQRKFIKYLEVNHGIKNRLVRLETDERVWRYVGLEPKTPFLS
jgi:hypothetical protein